jgi:hypothetical protein
VPLIEFLAVPLDRVSILVLDRQSHVRDHLQPILQGRGSKFLIMLLHNVAGIFSTDAVNYFGELFISEQGMLGGFYHCFDNVEDVLVVVEYARGIEDFRWVLNIYQHMSIETWQSKFFVEGLPAYVHAHLEGGLGDEIVVLD